MCSVVASRSTRFAIATVCIAVSQKLTVDFFCEIKKGGNIAVKSTHFWLLHLVVGGMQTNLVLYIYFLPSHAALQYIRRVVKRPHKVCASTLYLLSWKEEKMCAWEIQIFFIYQTRTQDMKGVLACVFVHILHTAAIEKVDVSCVNREANIELHLSIASSSCSHVIHSGLPTIEGVTL